jgi:hypothetical protein
VHLDRHLYKVIKRFLDKNLKKKVQVDKTEAKRAETITKLVNMTSTASMAAELTSKTLYQSVSLVDMYTSETTMYHNAKQIKNIIKTKLVS